VGDADVAQLKGMKALRHVGLTGTKVSDASLETLAGLPECRDYQLVSTRVSKRGALHLAGAKPMWNIGLWSETNRLVAERVLGLGGSVYIAEPGKDARPVKNAADLPLHYFQVRRISLAGVKKVPNEFLPLLAALKYAE